MQQTVKKTIHFSGLGIFTGANVELIIHPAPADYGIVFYRSDMQDPKPIYAHVDSVLESTRCTRIGESKESILMVEHLLSALYAYGVDNARIEVFGPEIPGLDGSSQNIAQAIEETGIQALEKEADFLEINHPVYFSSGPVHLVALPSTDLILSYTMHYPKSKLLGTQFYSFSFDEGNYLEEIAPCRTFSVYEEVLPLIERGLIKGGALENALVIKENKILNPDGARFPDEMVRHKVLDLIGDLSLIGKRLRAHVIAICSGHASNIAFAKTLLNSLSEDPINRIAHLSNK